jgi:hypothetical protein
MKTTKKQNMQNKQSIYGQNGFSFFSLCSALLSIVLLAMFMTSCSADEDLTVTTRDIMKNADGSITIHRISSVALPNGFTAATRAIATRAGETTEAVDEKTSWAEGDRLHIGIVIGNYPSIETYRFATIQADGSWLLNSDITIPASGEFYIFFNYLGKKYNHVDFNNTADNPDNFEKDKNGMPWAEGSAKGRMETVDGGYTKQVDATTGIITYSDILSAKGICTNGTWDSTNTNYTVSANLVNGIFKITMKHLLNRVGITFCDLSALGSESSVASITAKLVSKVTGTPEDYGSINLLPSSSVATGTQPSESAPWKAQVYNNYGLFLQSFVVTLVDGRKIPVSVPNASGSFDGIGREISHQGGEAYMYRLTLSPGSCTATPDANFTAPGWQTGETGAPTPIYTRTDLEAIASNLGGNYILMNDIDLSGSNWTPLGYTTDTPFTGKLNGNGHKITGMNIVVGSKDIYTGFFNVIKGGIVYNLHFSNCTVTGFGGGTSGTLVAALFSGYIFNCSVTNCNVIKGDCCGGMIGMAGGLDNKVVVAHCRVSNSSVQGSELNYYSKIEIGGLAGYIGLYSKMVACYTDGCTLSTNVLSKPDEASVGGLLGVSQGGTVFGCYATNVNAAEAISGNGALIGSSIEYGSTIAYITSSYGTKGTSNAATAILAKGSLTISNCVSLGAADYSPLVAVTAPVLTAVPTVTLSSSGSLSVVNRTWKATGIWGESEGASISQAPLINWSYNGE